MAKPVIVIGTPCFGGLVTNGYMESVIHLMHHAAGGAGYDVSLTTVGYDALITRGRATIAATFMDDPTATHLLFVDSDITFRPEQVTRLLNFDKDVVGAFYPLKIIDWVHMPERHAKGGESLERAGLSYVGEICTDDEFRTEDGFATAKYAGTGFLMIKRGVFERMMQAHPELKYTTIHASPRPTHGADYRYALFDCMIDPDTGIYLSEDYAFCRRWRALGGELWLDLKSELTHTGAHPFKGNTRDRFAALLAAGDISASTLKAKGA